MDCHNSILTTELSAPPSPPKKKNPKQCFVGWQKETRTVVPCGSFKLFLLGEFLSEQRKGKGGQLQRL